MTDPIRRALRTALVLIVTASGGVPALAAVFDISAGTVAKVLAVFAFAGTLLTALLNHVEDTTAFPAILKAPASEGENPLPAAPVKQARKSTKKAGKR